MCINFILLHSLKNSFGVKVTIKSSKIKKSGSDGKIQEEMTQKFVLQRVIHQIVRD